MQKPTIGRIVHFNNAGEIEAGIVIKVWSDTCVNLQVCNMHGTWNVKSSVSEGTESGSWMWPPRV